LKVNFKNAEVTGRKLMTLDSIPNNVTVRISSVDVPGAQGLRLMEMGLVPGAPIRIVKAAPLGDPIQVCIHNYHLALRRTEARAIKVKINL
jgi:Fe2+ transport system protein FeoA